MAAAASPAVANQLMAAKAPALVLASASTARAKLLAAAGLVVQCQAAAIDELSVKASLKAEGATPAQVAETLAELKAQRVAAKHPGALVIGADQLRSEEQTYGHQSL